MFGGMCGPSEMDGCDLVGQVLVVCGLVKVVTRKQEGGSALIAGFLCG